ncbi:MAG: transcription elongation factor GreA [Anaerolineaceae bacterium]|nr:transcription elongation factor GreA [Anaerolineaceae bacterium]
MNKATYLTRQGYEKLEAELDFLRNVRRKEIADELRDTMQNQDSDPGPEYIIVREQQSMVEGRISDILVALGTAHIIDKPESSDTVTIGSTVTIKQLDSFEENDPYNESPNEETYTIVGPLEAYPKNGFLSFEAPLGRALLGRSVLDTVEVNVPDGKLKIQIIDIR